jgi:hypothetical protein
MVIASSEYGDFRPKALPLVKLSVKVGVPKVNLGSSGDVVDVGVIASVLVGKGVAEITESEVIVATATGV